MMKGILDEAFNEGFLGWARRRLFVASAFGVIEDFGDVEEDLEEGVGEDDEGSCGLIKN